jgi:hypothetical protein
MLANGCIPKTVVVPETEIVSVLGRFEGFKCTITVDDGGCRCSDGFGYGVR